jgi:hypothetical protein
MGILCGVRETGRVYPLILIAYTRESRLSVQVCRSATERKA